MIASMTGFGSGEFGDQQTNYRIEMRSVNHRFLDLKIRMPRDLMRLEPKIRKIISGSISRGSVDIFVIRDHQPGEEEAQLILNKPIAKKYHEILKTLSSELNLTSSVAVETIAKFNDVISVPNIPVDHDREWKLLEKGINGAVTALVEMRKGEGKELEKDLLSRISELEKSTNEIEKQSGKLVEKYREKLQARINEMQLDSKVDPQRIAQEIALYADRSDISEELVRLASHFGQFRDTIKKGGVIGRRLEFIIQELHRETNTIGSKLLDADTAALIQMKSTVEKMREQVQNIE